MQYGDRLVEIHRVSMLDPSGADRRAFETGESVRIRLHWRAHARVERPAFVFCVYLPDGQCAAQVWARGEAIGLEVAEGEGAVDFVFDPLLLGQSAYVASAAVFKHLRDDGMEAPAYHVWDRCIHFQVRQAAGKGPARGLVAQPYTASIASPVSPMVATGKVSGMTR
jgi:lipopolysaccharide transport system ATP-binding protein